MGKFKEFLEITEVELDESSLFYKDTNVYGKYFEYQSEYYKCIEANRTPSEILVAIKSLDGKVVKGFINPSFINKPVSNVIEDNEIYYRYTGSYSGDIMALYNSDENKKIVLTADARDEYGHLSKVRYILGSTSKSDIKPMKELMKIQKAISGGSIKTEIIEGFARRADGGRTGREIGPLYAVYLV